MPDIASIVVAVCVAFAVRLMHPHSPALSDRAPNFTPVRLDPTNHPD
jgi:hypothetical protein